MPSRSPERGFYYSASKHSAGQPIVAGWNYQWISQLCFTPDSWTAPCDVIRIPPRADTTNATVDQVRRLVELLGDDGDVPMFVFDAGYDPIAIGYELADNPQPRCCAGSATTASSTPPPRPARTDQQPPGDDPHATGPGSNAPIPQHGQSPPTISSLLIPATAPSPSPPGTDSTRGWGDAVTGPTTTSRRSSTAPSSVSTSSTSRNRPPRRRRRCGCGGPVPDVADLDLCWRAYLRRFDIEHTFRFAKNTLGWTTPSLCTPEQADRWTWLIIAALTQLRLARPLVEDQRLPWERHRQPHQLTPARVRRGFRRLGTIIGTPARPPKPARAGPGRPKGTTETAQTTPPSHQESCLTTHSGV